MKPYETPAGYLALHAMMIHIWSIDECLSPDMDPDEATELQTQLTDARFAVRDAFKIDPDAIIPDEDWDMANVPVPNEYCYKIETVSIEYNDGEVFSPNK